WLPATLRRRRAFDRRRPAHHHHGSSRRPGVRDNAVPPVAAQGACNGQRSAMGPPPRVGNEPGAGEAAVPDVVPVPRLYLFVPVLLPGEMKGRYVPCRARTSLLAIWTSSFRILSSWLPNSVWSIKPRSSGSSKNSSIQT